jgi:hypothetical protein
MGLGAERQVLVATVGVDVVPISLRSSLDSVLLVARSGPCCKLIRGEAAQARVRRCSLQSILHSSMMRPAAAVPRTRRDRPPATAGSPATSARCRCRSLSEDDQGRSGHGVRAPRPRSVGLNQGRHARLLATGEAHRHAYIEAFNGRFRAECLNAHWFLTLADVTEKMEDCRRYYNEVRPHGAIGHKVPISLLNSDGATSPPS